MQISGPQLKELQEALISAFPTRQDLSMMVTHGLDENLLALVDSGGLEYTVFELLRWAVAKGRCEELVKAALSQNSQNPQLLRVAARLGVKRDQTSSSDVPLSKGPRYWNIPYPRNPFFTGQEAVLMQLATALKQGEVAALSQPQAITGLGGIGKTQIALEYAYQHRQDYQAVLWTLADTRESLVSGYIAIAQLLGLSQKDEQDQAVIVQAVMSWLQTHSSWLLVLDNADELAMVRECVPASFGGYILLTTRAQSMGRFAKGIEVETMNQDVGALFLLRRVGLVAENAQLDAAFPSDVVTAKKISEELGGLPLALDQAGAYIEENQSGLASYLSLYHAQRAELLKERGGLIDDHCEPVATTWSLSFGKVEERNPAAADLLRFCAFVSADAIPEEMITVGAESLGANLQEVVRSPLSWNKAIAALLAYSLIRRNAQEKTLSVHRLVQAVLKDAMDKQARRQWVESVVLAVNEVFPFVEFTTWPQCERYLSHVLVCAELVEQYQIIGQEVAR